MNKKEENKESKNNDVAEEVIDGGAEAVLDAVVDVVKDGAEIVVDLAGGLLDGL